MQNLLPWLALKRVPGIGNHLYGRLIDRFETPDKVFEASKSELVKVEGVSPALADAIKGYRPDEELQKEIDLAQKQGVRIITLGDSEYPALLKQIHDPPPYLYLKGSLAGTETGIAVVGARNASSYGMAMAKQLCRDLALMGMTIVSGMARGIDTAAHTGALEAEGKTVAVLGSGLGVIYPYENKNLFYRISETGAVVSEFPMMEEPLPYNFPARNRIISGMTLGTVVVEAAKRSGSLITARLAGEQGREVFAVPGNVNSLKSAGAHNLLKQGAKLVSCAQDVMEEFPQLAAGVASKRVSGKAGAEPLSTALPDLTGEEARVFDMLEPYPIHIDELSRKVNMPIGRLSGILLNLELKGAVSQSPGKYFSIREDIKR